MDLVRASDLDTELNTIRIGGAPATAHPSCLGADANRWRMDDLLASC